MIRALVPGVKTTAESATLRRRVTRFAREYRRVARSLSRVDLVRRSMSLVLTEDDIHPGRQDDDRRFLDYYSDEGLALALERYGFTRAVEERGFRDMELETRSGDDRHTLVISALPEGDEERCVLVELVVRRDLLKATPGPGLPTLPDGLETLTIDWLMMESPRASFTEARPRLPGQEAPGLGLAERVLEMLYRATERLNLATLVTVPDHFHNAHLYARELPFFDPWYAGQLRALERLLLEDNALSLAQASWAVEWGHVRRADGRVFTWHGQLMAWPHAPAIREYFAHPTWAAEVDDAARHNRHELDRAEFDARWARESPRLTH